MRSPTPIGSVIFVSIPAIWHSSLICFRTIYPISPLEADTGERRSKRKRISLVGTVGHGNDENIRELYTQLIISSTLGIRRTTPRVSFFTSETSNEVFKLRCFVFARLIEPDDDIDR
jgi:hypothetical protein